MPWCIADQLTDGSYGQDADRQQGRSRLGASVSVKFSQEFATQVGWQKIDERTGAIIEEEDITDGGDTPGGGGDTPGGDNGGSGGDNGSGDLEG